MSEAEAQQDSSSPAARPGFKSSGDAWNVQIAAFEGPLDLLLHLVRVNEVEITDIPIVEITEQYNAHLEMMRDLRLEIAGEYLVMASTLMHIKSRMLLPPDPDAEDGAEADDPRAELAQQLLEYQRYKQAAEGLEAMQSRRSLIWTRDAIPESFRDEELVVVEMYDLVSAFRKLLGRLGEEERLRFKKDNVSVAEKMAWLEELLERRESLRFDALLAGLPTRLDRIATFLAILELMRLRVLVVFQRKVFDEIRIARTPRPAAAATDEEDS